MNFQKKILVIDGDQDFGNTITKSLTLHKYDVCYVTSGITGIQKAFEFQPDLILCDMDLQPFDGIQVHKILLDSFVLKSIPFIFLKSNATIEQVRQGMNLGADDYFSKPLSMAELLRSIEIRLEKFKNNGHRSAHDFITLFEPAPNGIMLFSESAIFRTNRSIRSLLNIDHQKSTPLRMDDIFEKNSLRKIKSWMQQPFKSTNDVFNERIILMDQLGEELEIDLVISELYQNMEFVEYIGFFSPIFPLPGCWDNGQLIDELVGLLEQEKIAIPAPLSQKISYLVQQRGLDITVQENSFFTKRENQVLFLTMGGFPIKNIADKLSISTRTVEKYRTKLMEKSGAKNIVEVIVFALKNGLIKI